MWNIPLVSTVSKSNYDLAVHVRKQRDFALENSFTATKSHHFTHIRHTFTLQLHIIYLHGLCFMKNGALQNTLVSWKVWDHWLLHSVIWTASCEVENKAVAHMKIFQIYKKVRQCVLPQLKNISPRISKEKISSIKRKSRAIEYASMAAPRLS